MSSVAVESLGTETILQSSPRVFQAPITDSTQSDNLLTPTGVKVGEGQVIVGASAASFPNSSGVNARTVVVRAFPDDVIATTN